MHLCRFSLCCSGSEYIEREIARNFRSMKHIYAVEGCLNWAGWLSFVWLCIVCLLNKWSIEREHGQLIIYHKFETKHLFKCTNKCAANRKVFNVQTRNSVECDFWHLCQRRYGNVYSIGKRMSKWIMPVWHMHSYQSSIRFAMIRIHRRLSLINMKWEIERHTRREEGEEAE